MYIIVHYSFLLLSGSDIPPPREPNKHDLKVMYHKIFSSEFVIVWIRFLLVLHIFCSWQLSKEVKSTYTLYNLQHKSHFKQLISEK